MNFTAYIFCFLKCSFAHGKHELKEKIHLHTNYKTKPCQQYFMKGYCFYGYRCQYLHSEIKYLPEFLTFVKEAYQNSHIENKLMHNSQTESIILYNMGVLYEKSLDLKHFFEKTTIFKKYSKLYLSLFPSFFVLFPTFFLHIIIY